MKKSIFILVIILLVVIYALGYLKNPASHQVETAQAMHALYGNYSTSSQASIWTNPENKEEYSVAPLISYTNANRFYLLTKATSPKHQAHVEAAIIGAHILKNEQEIKTVYSNKAFDHLGTLGDFPKEQASLLRISDNTTGFLLNPGFTGQGYTVTSYVLTAPIQDSFKEVLHFSKASESFPGLNLQQPPIPAYANTSKIDYIRNQDSTFYDLIIEKTGTQPNSEGKLSLIHETHFFHFDESKQKYEE